MLNAFGRVLCACIILALLAPVGFAAQQRSLTAPVAPISDREDVLVEGFDGRDDEQGAGGNQFTEHRSMLQKMFDFGGEVPRQVGPSAMHLFGRAHGMGRAVEEIRIAERDVPGALLNLAGDIVNDDIGRYDEEPAVIDGR